MDELDKHAPAPALRRADVLWSALLGLGALTLYASTACRTIHTGDSPELALAITTFGVPHPPGYALYTLLSGLLARLIPVIDRAFAANLVSVFYGALTVSLLFLLARRLGLGLLAATVSAIALMVSRTFWSQALIAEVYTFDILLLLVALHALLSWSQRPRPRATLLLGFALGLWLGHRFVNVLYLPALALLAAWSARISARRGLEVLLRARGAWLLAGLGGLLALAIPLAYLPLASATDPPLDIGDPETWDRLWTVLTGAPYRRHLFAGGLTPAARRIAHVIANLPLELGVGLVLAGFGALTRSSTRRPLIALFALIAANVALAAIYNILDIRQYMLPTLVALALLAAYGVESLRPHLLRRPRMRPLLSTLLLLAALLPLLFNAGANTLSKHRLARQFATDLLDSLPKNTALFVNGDTVVHSLWYLQGVEGLRDDVLVISAGHLAPWHLDQLRKRHPAEPWPTARTMKMADARYRLVAALAQRRPIFLSLNANSLLGPGGERARRRFAPLRRAFATELAPRGKMPSPAQAREDARRVEEAVGRAAPLLRARPDDVDTQALVLEYAMALFRSAAALQRWGDRQGARRLLQRVDAIDPDPLEARMARAYLIIGREAPALRLGERARQLLATNGKGARRSPATPTSRPASRAASGAASNADALNQRGVALARAGKMSQALAFFERALQARPDHVGARFNRAKTLAALGRRGEAISAFEALATRKSASAVVLSHLADLVATETPARARKLLERALQAPDGSRFASEIRRRLKEL